MSETKAKPKSSWLNLVVDFGPIAVFFAVYRWFKPEGDAALGEIFAVTRGTIGFMIAAVIALLVSKFKLGKVSPMLWLSTALIMGFGALTVFLGDPFWVQIKPTVIYLLFAAALLGAALRGQALLKVLLQAAFEGLDQAGWLKLSRNWGFFFLFLAALNEVLRQWLSFESWLVAKLWVFMPLSFLFTFTQIPMLLRHGLVTEAEEEVLSDPPHE